MASSVESAPSFHFYSHLPFEIRLAIIEEFVNDYCPIKEYDPDDSLWEYDFGDCPRLAKYATVDREWQSVVEKRTFRSLEFCVRGTDRPSVFDDLEQICVADRINAISEIHLLIVVDGIDCWTTEVSDHNDITACQIAIGKWEEASCVRADRVATAAFRYLFQVLERWSRKRVPLSLTFELSWGMDKPDLTGEHVQVASSDFPEVTCIGSIKLLERRRSESWVEGINAHSMFRLLAKLPNVKEATVTCEDDNYLGTPSVLQEWRSCPNFQGSKLKTLTLKGLPEFCQHPLLETSQSIFAMTSRLEDLDLDQVVDVRDFLTEASRAGGNRSGPGWPNMRTLRVVGPSSVSRSDDADLFSELYESITEALPHMPNITFLEVGVMNNRRYEDYAFVGISASRPDDRSLVGSGELRIASNGFRPDEGTVQEWKRIARSQWRCNLEYVPKKDDSENAQGPRAD